MKTDLSIPKNKKVSRPKREPDYFSKRGVAYWWSPDWVRSSNSSNSSFSRIFPKATSDSNVDLYMLGKEGNTTYIQGSIQEEFKKWHEDNQIDCILLGISEDELLATRWQYE